MVFASSYGHFSATKEFLSQCHILLVLMERALNGAIKGTFKGKVERHSSSVYSSLVNLRGESGAHEAPDVALLISSIKRRTGESQGAFPTAAPLDTE